MKKGLFFFWGLVIGVTIGFALGYLKLPFIEDNKVAVLFGVSLVLMVQAALFFLKAKSSRGRGQKVYKPLSIVLFGLIVLGVIIGKIFFGKSQNQLESKLQEQTEKLDDLTTYLHSVENNKEAELLRKTLEKIEQEANSNPSRIISEITIEQLIALSSSFQARPVLINDTLSDDALSSSRGELLLALIRLKLDSSIFSQLIKNVSFEKANLEQANLEGMELSGINLSGANLKNAKLKGSKLKNANLMQAKLWGGDLESADLSNANLENSNLLWANLNGIQGEKLNLNGANLENAQMMNAEIPSATFRFTNLSGAMLNESNLQGGDIARAILANVNLTNTDLTSVRIRTCDFSSANLENTELENTEVEEDWFDRIPKKQKEKYWETLKQYVVVKVNPEGQKKPVYRLRKQLSN